MNNSKVSIIIPCYNKFSLEYFNQAVASAKAQTYKNIEVIGSNCSDNLSAARNHGISISTGEYIICLDADDLLHPDFVNKTIGLNEIVATAWQEIGTKDKIRIPETNLTHESFISNNQIVCTSIFKKEIWEAIGGFDENMVNGFEDWDFWLRATKSGYKVSVVPEVLFYYRKYSHNNSMLVEAMKNKKEITEYIYKKNGITYQVQS